MDHSAKQYLVSRVVECAKRFQLQRRRKQLTSRDVHDAIHALGLRPLFSPLQVGVEESLNASDIVSEPLNGRTGHDITLSVLVAEDALWRPSEECFRKRKILPQNSELSMNTLSDKSKFYAEKIINSVDSQTVANIAPPSDADILITSWFLGLVFSSRVESSERIVWTFIRNCVWYLHRAIETHAKMSQDAFPARLREPWTRGLERIAQGREIESESEHQAILVKRICSQLVESLI